MSDIPTTARTARESLARGLSALQSDPNIPPQLVDLAAPIAQAMSALHQIERNNGSQLSPFADTALQNVRTALSSLQAQPNQHPAVAQAMEAVAGSLGLVHALSKLASPGAAAAQPAPAQPAPAQPAFPQPAQPYAPPPAQQPAYAQPAQQPYAPPPAQQPAYAQPAQQPYAPPAQQAYAPPPAQNNPYAAQAAPPAFGQAAPDPFGGGRSPMAATALAPPGAGPVPPGMPVSGRPPSPPAVGDAPTINADLGANSPSNFYKGLSGNDIIDHGGLFVSTYMIPKIGTPVRLRVSMPGGYEFEANGVVRWSREATGDAAPGFGAQLTQITPEARQLVYRYVRNREPLFHDDL